MDLVPILPFLADSEPFVIVTILVFLALTSPRQGKHRRSGRSVGTGRHRETDVVERETETDSAKVPSRP